MRAILTRLNTSAQMDMRPSVNASTALWGSWIRKKSRPGDNLHGMTLRMTQGHSDQLYNSLDITGTNLMLNYSVSHVEGLL